MSKPGIYFPATIHTHGICSSDPGPGGFAAIIEYGDYRMIVMGGDPNTTPEQMELSAIVEVLRLVNSEPDLLLSHLTIRSDSQNIVNAFKDNCIEDWQRSGWLTTQKKPVANHEIWEDILTEIKGHSPWWVLVHQHNTEPIDEKSKQLAAEQAALAPNQPGYWCSTDNPLSAATAADTPHDTLPEQASKPDAEQLLRNTLTLINEALTASRQGNATATDNILMTALQQIGAHFAQTGQAPVSPSP